MTKILVFGGQTLRELLLHSLNNDLTPKEEHQILIMLAKHFKVWKNDDEEEINK